MKSVMMPLTMIVGGVCHSLFFQLGFLTPYLIFAMLFITFCRISLKDMRMSGMYIWLILFQIVVSLVLYMALRGFNESAAQGAMICVFAPTATAAAVVAAMLGANIATMATYSLISNIVVALTAPLIFSLVGGDVEISFWQSVGIIASRVIPLLLAPLVFAMLLRKIYAPLHIAITTRQS